MMKKIKRFYDRYSDSEEYGRILSKTAPLEVVECFCKYYNSYLFDENMSPVEDILDKTREYLAKNGYEEYVKEADKKYLEFMESIFNRPEHNTGSY
jgi:uncharacterized protein with von Willebrand factor type A (vWA) domain